MFKVSLFSGETEYGPTVLPLFTRNDAVFEKTAAASLLPEVVRYIDSLRPSRDSQYVLVNAMGAGEYFGSNINGDYFTEASLIHRPDDWTGNPLLDKIKAKTWPYGFPTFYEAHPYAHHRNKDAARAFGEVELAVWHDRMKRVELVARVDKQKCQEFGGVPVWDKLQGGQHPDVSMGCKVPFDTCSICLDWKMYREAQDTFDSKTQKHPGEAILQWHKNKHKIRGLSITRADYCDHAKKQMNKILPDGRKVFVYNDFPKFFDISFVFIGADKTAKVMMKIAGAGVGGFWDIGGSAELAEKLGYAEEGEKTAGTIVLPDGSGFFTGTVGKKKKVEKVAFKLEGHTDHQGLPIAIENMKGSVRSGVDKDGHKWRTVMRHHYGYIKGTKGADGDPVDAFLGTKKDSPHAFVVHQRKATGDGYDEDKVMLGFASKEDAVKGYLANYDKEGKKLLGPVSKVPLERLKELVKSKEKLEKISFNEAAFKLAFLGKAAKSKRSEIIKDYVPSQFAGKAIPALAAAEQDIPKDLLDIMAKAPLEKSLSTSGGLGMVLRPREFQRIVLISIGKKDMADDYEDRGITFPESDEKIPMDLGPSHFLGPLAKLLMPLFEHRSALAPAIEKRVVIISGAAPEKEKKSASSHTTELLRKIGAAYNSYREQLMDLASHSPELIAKTAYPFQVELRKLSSAGTEELFSPLSVAYIESAFLNEVGQRRENGQNKLAMSAGVERGYPSRNT